MTTRFVLAMCLAGACAKDEPAPQPAEKTTTAPAVVGAPTAPAAPGGSDEISVTSKSPEAIAHFKRGRDKIDNLRFAESVEHLEKAVELDPTFALATVYLGIATPGNEAFVLIDRAVELARNLPEPERAFIEAQQALSRNDNAGGRSLLQKVVAAKPRDWRAQITLAQLAFADENWDEAVSASTKTIEINPNNPLPYNLLAYGHVWQGHRDEAIAAAQRQVDLLPDEPNPLDTQAEILLAANRLDEALAAFEKAGEKSPKFTLALVGAAETQMYQGDWKGGYATLKRAHDAAPRPEDGFGVGITEMFALAGQGKLAEGLKVGEEVEQAALAAKRDIPAIFATLNRGLLLALSGKSADAVKLVDAAYARAQQAQLAQPVMRAGMLLGEQVRLIAALNAKKPAHAEKAYATLEAEAKKAQLSKADQSLLDWGQGVVAWTKGDAKAAVDSMKRCSQFDYLCRAMLVSAQRAAGDKPGATETLANLKSSPRRANEYVYFWSAAK